MYDADAWLVGWLGRHYARTGGLPDRAAIMSAIERQLAEAERDCMTRDGVTADAADTLQKRVEAMFRAGGKITRRRRLAALAILERWRQDLIAQASRRALLHDGRRAVDPRAELRSVEQRLGAGRQCDELEDWAALDATAGAEPAAVVDRLFRAGDVVNVVSHSKAGKSWLALGLALAIITGRRWLGTFATGAGRVLLIDYELRRATIRKRVRAVCAALGIDPPTLAGKLSIWSMRGRHADVLALRQRIERIEPGAYTLVIVDPLYRAMPAGKSENEPETLAEVYGAIGEYAETTGAAFALVHHATKGAQGEKRITDVGSGHGTQSRAGDCHLVLREAAEAPDLAILDAANRTFAPVEPMTLRWTYPVWWHEPGTVAAAKGAQPKNVERQIRNDAENAEKIVDALADGKARLITRLSRMTGITRDVLGRVLNQLIAVGRVRAVQCVVRGQIREKYKKTEK